MYPFLRLITSMARAYSQPPLPITGEHEMHTHCWPWDLDPFMELNNGRALSLYDLGRLPLFQRTGLFTLLRQKKWGMTMAGACVRYRRRVRLFSKVKIRTRFLCLDERFLYIEQSMWRRDGDCAGHILYRAAVTDQNGIVPTDRVLSALGVTDTKFDTPDWVSKWIAAENARPWPPMQD